MRTTDTVRGAFVFGEASGEPCLRYLDEFVVVEGVDAEGAVGAFGDEVSSVGMEAEAGEVGFCLSEVGDELTVFGSPDSDVSVDQPPGGEE